MMGDARRTPDAAVSNEITGGVFFRAVIQGRDIAVCAVPLRAARPPPWGWHRSRPTRSLLPSAATALWDLGRAVVGHIDIWMRSPTMWCRTRV
ncbi:hypothetical protein GCM10011579_068150 [Streptomyces albiflavescens]|uniref:Uncharacterized protein n=1 Tax=Streptomyces albiflavescens TaxID=1623582 RepID=A0A917Y9Q6_9ACTN|nr:hypothetical protein GCM10011579_068150 [Streptomyces albiflavescens]